MRLSDSGVEPSSTFFFSQSDFDVHRENKRLDQLLFRFVLCSTTSCSNWVTRRWARVGCMGATFAHVCHALHEIDPSVVHATCLLTHAATQTRNLVLFAVGSPSHAFWEGGSHSLNYSQPLPQFQLAPHSDPAEHVSASASMAGLVTSCLHNLTTLVPTFRLRRLVGPFVLEKDCRAKT